MALRKAVSPTSTLCLCLTCTWSAGLTLRLALTASGKLAFSLLSPLVPTARSLAVEDVAVAMQRDSSRQYIHLIDVTILPPSCGRLTFRILRLEGNLRAPLVLLLRGPTADTFIGPLRTGTSVKFRRRPPQNEPPMIGRRALGQILT